MPFQIIRQDITQVSADAIVNTANPQVAVGRGTDLAIYQAAGHDQLLHARERIGALQPGSVGVTSAFQLSAKYIFHAVGPYWQGGQFGERETLRQCYRRCLELADELKCESIAFPLMGSGNDHFPKDEALQIALETFSAFLDTHELQVTLVVFDPTSFELSKDLMGDIEAYIDDAIARQRHVEENPPGVTYLGDRYRGGATTQRPPTSTVLLSEEPPVTPQEPPVVPMSAPPAADSAKPAKHRLRNLFGKLRAKPKEPTQTPPQSAPPMAHAIPDEELLWEAQSAKPRRPEEKAGRPRKDTEHERREAEEAERRRYEAEEAERRRREAEELEEARRRYEAAERKRQEAEEAERRRLEEERRRYEMDAQEPLLCEPPLLEDMSLEDMLSHKEASFQQRLFQLIDASGLDDVRVYKKANIDRRLFSRIKSKADYKPKKTTAVAFAIALELDMGQLSDLVSRAGFSISPSNTFDIIISYFVTHKIYDVYEINAALFKYDQPLIGA